MKRRDVLAGLCSVSVIALASCGMPSSPTDNVEAVDGDIRAAFQFIYPMYEIARIAQDRTGAIDGQSGRLNQIVHRAVLMCATDTVQLTDLPVALRAPSPGGAEADADGILPPGDGQSANDWTETLYIEIRENNEPVDPALWFRTDKED